MQRKTDMGFNMQQNRVSIAALLASCLVGGCYFLHNVESNTSPEDFSTVTAAEIAIGYGWPFVCISGMIDTEKHFYATGFWSLWENTKQPKFVWFGIVLNMAIAVVLVYSVYKSASWIQHRLQLGISITSMLGLTLFSALVVFNRTVIWNDYTDINPDIPGRLLINELLNYAGLIVWASIFVSCLWLPTLIKPSIGWFPCLRLPNARNEEMHRSSGGSTTWHNESNTGTR
jgi:hypothetical protein